MGFAGRVVSERAHKFEAVWASTENVAVVCGG